tara:strand:- start:62 stop:622 length:561 start_codon:yes stop_codon:yes gene_type:complete
MIPFIDVYEPASPATEAQNLLNVLLEQSQFTGSRHELLNLIRQIESGGGYGPKTVRYPFGNPKAESGTGARGVYQFKDKESKPNKKGVVEDAVRTARNRAKNLGFDKAFVNLIPDDPRQWTDQEADIMVLANLFAQSKVRKGFVDDLLVKAFGGDRKAMQDAYELHHTSLSDEGTSPRLNRFIPLK